MDSNHTRPRRLLLCLDGVPHKLIEQEKSRGLFDTFGAPTRLLSPFPTMTNVALSAMLGASPPAGYESLYFDRGARELRGGIRKYLGRRTPDKIPSSYMDDLDYQEPLPFEFLIYVAPEKIWRADMQRFRERFRTAPQNRDYFAFLKATDGLLHAQGPERLAIALESLDKILREIQQYCYDDIEIVMFSDHGMNLEENRRANLASTLQRRGFRVVIPAFGLCSYAAIYCDNADQIPEIAVASAEVTGIDFAIYKDAADVVIESERGRARIEYDPATESYRYVMAGGDPLELSTFDDGFATEEVWFEQTAGHRYPNALPNIYKSLFTPRVKHTADVLISLKDGYYCGWTPFGRFVRLAATHGNALQASSNAFLMSTHRQFAPFVRADDAKALLRG
ncbi:MAG TPA: alkaline phosphatase family protein [Pyrinomonadaceae bacterium]|jgi:Type I phosphodiesterase / nucleotide pyrophosphatase|nr:alkaline phosphatase family protein [Pyrinomonadaceae bacterium]